MNEWITAGNGGGADIWDKAKPIEGKYISKKSNTGTDGNSNLYRVQEQGKTEPTGVWGSAVLDGRFEEIPFGSLVHVEYKGKAKGKNGREYNDYEVKYQRPAATSGLEASDQSPMPVYQGKIDNKGQINLDDIPF